MSIQDSLDQLLPALIPVLLVGFVYWLLGKKKMNSTRVIWLILVLAIALHVFGILA